MADFVIKQGDTGRPIRATLYDLLGHPVDLTGCTIQFRMRPHGGGALTVDALATVVVDVVEGITAEDGVVEYEWQDGETDAAGDYDAEWVALTGFAGELTWPNDGYTTITITDDLEANAESTPALPTDCWPVDATACEELGGFSASVQALAKAYAGQTLRMLTGYRVGGCPINVRPCTRTCAGASPGWYAWGGGFRPYIDGAGDWLNACGCAVDCDHLGSAAITLPGPVGSIDEVLVDGDVVDPSDYRLDGDQLVRLDGGVWPTTQNMTLASTEVGTFAITYLRGIPVDGIGAYAAGLLACEFANALSGGKCRLPAGVTTITRQGVTMEIQSGAFPGGRTGIREVDAYIQRWNPNALKAPSSVWSPDLPHTRITS